MSTTVALVVSQQERAEGDQQGLQIATEATALVVKDQPSFEAAVAWLRDTVAPLKAKIADTFRPRIQQAHELHKGLLADERRFLGPVLDAERLVRGRCATYEQAVEDQRKAAEAAARREQERLEAEERARVAAEQKRLQAEAEERRLAEAAKAEEAGDKATAERLISAPVVVPAVAPRPVFVPPPSIAAPKAEGYSSRDAWSAEVTNLMALVKAVAAGKAPLSYLKADEVALNGVARALKNAMNVPGVKAVQRRTSSVSRA